MKANEILEAVAATITQRGAQNGYDKKEERSAAEVARLYNTKRVRKYEAIGETVLLAECLTEQK